MRGILLDMPVRGRILAAGLLAALVALPAVADRYVLSVLILVLYFAYVGQAWNLMMGFAGQLSLGHAAFFGIGAYALPLYHDKLVIPLPLTLVLLIVTAVAAAFGAAIGWLGFASASPASISPCSPSPLPNSPASASTISLPAAPPACSSLRGCTHR
jgi:branched-chain amino acid transport system permease protein